MLAAVTATRYVLPLREGGSLPGLVEADDLGTYVVKWRAAGQGVPVLAAEVICGELARALALPVPALVTVDVAPELAVGSPTRRCRSCSGTPPAPTWAWTTCPARWTSPRTARTCPRSWPVGCCGSTRWSATSTGPGATRTCSSGTAGCS
ncbi:HipA family kinase [Klenkia terrae]|uniref:HipA family kinase n=1 Tax=Klenkia terrae TaxID=1052259 RepID=UPI00361E084D